MLLKELKGYWFGWWILWKTELTLKSDFFGILVFWDLAMACKYSSELGGNCLPATVPKHYLHRMSHADTVAKYYLHRDSSWHSIKVLPTQKLSSWQNQSTTYIKTVFLTQYQSTTYTYMVFLTQYQNTTCRETVLLTQYQRATYTDCCRSLLPLSKLKSNQQDVQDC